MPTTTTLPTTRTCPFDPPSELRRLREEDPIRPLAYPDGHTGWLVTGYRAARAVLSDARLSARSELHHMPLESLEPVPKAPGNFIFMDPPEHTRYRRLLTGQFTVRRMSQLIPRIEEITRKQLDAMEHVGPPVDLVEAFALPIPSQVICELLGVPYADHERFEQDTRTLVDLKATEAQRVAAGTDLATFLAQLIPAKRAEPQDDLLSGLVAASDLADEDLVGVSLLLLVAGHETTANMLALGTYTLLSHPDQLATLRADPSLVDGAVEELLRHLTILHLGTMRTALKDVELDGHTIKAGQTVTISLSAANRDPERFSDPDRLDVTRDASGHLAFGHGIHQCLGQQLARVEMRIGYPALLRRFPELRLAVPPEEILLREDMEIYGVHRLPVTW
ncbi:MAG: cytochrome P450 [Egibacteraceae bacterium]